jgi:hypothetical protein
MTLIVESIRNAKIKDNNGHEIECYIKYKNLPERLITLSVASTDEEEKELYNKILFGEYGDIEPLVETITEEESLVRSVKAKRNTLLAESDWTQLPDVPEETRSKWFAYRQALRDITQQTGYPKNVTFPEKPE